MCDVVIANRWNDELADIETRCTRGTCLGDCILRVELLVLTGLCAGIKFGLVDEYCAVVAACRKRNKV